MIAHRGASLLTPENTMAAFNLAVEVGAHAIELDAKLSQDGEVVSFMIRLLIGPRTARVPLEATPWWSSGLWMLDLISENLLRVNGCPSLLMYLTAWQGRSYSTLN